MWEIVNQQGTTTTYRDLYSKGANNNLWRRSLKQKRKELPLGNVM
jgi:hypothetical protein